MKFTFNGKEVDAGEWLIDILGTFAVFWVASGFLMEEGKSVAEQPVAFAVTLGIALAGFKLLRQWKALS